MKLNEKLQQYYLIRKLFNMKLVKVHDYYSNDPIYFDPADVSNLTMAYDFSGGNVYTIVHHGGGGYGSPGTQVGGSIGGQLSQVAPTKSHRRVAITLKNGAQWQVKEHAEIIVALIEGRDPGPATVLYGEANGNESKQDQPT